VGRLQLWEIIDQPWCPRAVREGVTEYLQIVARLGRPYRLVAPLVRRALERTGSHEIIDLGSGTGGPWPGLLDELHAAGAPPVHVTLTDALASEHTARRVEQAAAGRLRYHRAPVDARRVPSELTGVRTLFSAFHHFSPAEARAVLADAVRGRCGIAVFEMTHRSAWPVAAMLLTPPLALLAMPLVRPVRFSRLVYTYLLPVIPAVTTFDGVVSCLRTYSPGELLDLAGGVATDGYRWEAGELEASAPPFIPVTYLVGYPDDGGAQSTPHSQEAR
jgi:hypothetical protein